MPFQNSPKFDLETVMVMADAYDAVITHLKLQRKYPRTSRLATLIVQLAQAGVLDADLLADRAKAGLQ